MLTGSYFFPINGPALREDALIAGLSHTWVETLGALPALAANSHLPCVCGAGCD